MKKYKILRCNSVIKKVLWGQRGGGELLGVVLVVRSHGRTNATSNLHFFADLRVRGTP